MQTKEKEHKDSIFKGKQRKVFVFLFMKSRYYYKKGLSIKVKGILEIIQQMEINMATFRILR